MAGDLLSNNPDLPIAAGVPARHGARGSLRPVQRPAHHLGSVPALVVTLGTLYTFRGLAFLWTDGRQVNAEKLPDSFLTSAPTPSSASRCWCHRARGGPRGRAVAARLPLRAGALRDRLQPGGRPARRRALRAQGPHRLRAAGALAGLAGVLFTARFATVDATAGTGYELTVIAAAVVGGVAIFGGTGSVYGAALGALLLGTITSSLIVLRSRPSGSRRPSVRCCCSPSRSTA